MGHLPRSHAKFISVVADLSIANISVVVSKKFQHNAITDKSTSIPLDLCIHMVGEPQTDPARDSVKWLKQMCLPLSSTAASIPAVRESHLLQQQPRIPSGEAAVLNETPTKRTVPTVEPMLLRPTKKLAGSVPLAIVNISEVHIRLIIHSVAENRV